MLAGSEFAQSRGTIRSQLQVSLHCKRGLFLCTGSVALFELLIQDSNRKSGFCCMDEIAVKTVSTMRGHICSQQMGRRAATLCKEKKLSITLHTNSKFYNRSPSLKEVVEFTLDGTCRPRTSFLCHTSRQRRRVRRSQGFVAASYGS